MPLHDDNRFRWLEHFILVLGYLGLLFTTVFLDWFSSENLFIIVLGYVMSIAIFIITIDFVSDRIKKKILVQWALIIVPFGKWPHFLYRSFAMYFAKIKR